MKRVEGRVAVVTGGALGIGEGTARLLAREGAKVAVTDILDDEGRRVAEAIQAEGGTARYWRMDVGDEAEVARVMGEVVEAFGEIDVLVNNAGVLGVNKPTHETTEEEWDFVQKVNVKGVFFCTKHAVPSMKRAGRGSIINLSSIYGLVGAPDLPAYHASKGAVRLMTKTDAMLYAGDGIRVNSIHPGTIWTPMVEGHFRAGGIDPAEGRKQMEGNEALGYVGEPQDIGWAVVYLASDESRFMTGSEMVIDGGYTAK